MIEHWACIQEGLNTNFGWNSCKISDSHSGEDVSVNLLCCNEFEPLQRY